MKFQISPRKQEDETLVLIPVFKTEDYATFLKNILEKYNFNIPNIENDFSADIKSISILYTPTHKIALLGLGKKYEENEIIRAFRFFFFKQKNTLQGKIGIDIEHIAENFLPEIVNGILLGGYDTQLYKTDKKQDKNWFLNNESNIVFYSNIPTKTAEKYIDKGQKIADSQMSVMDIVNAAPNFKTPKTISEWAIQSGKTNGFEVRILDKAQLEKEKLGCLLAVGNAGRVEPHLILMEYKPKNATKKVGLVGKGITFDNGGVSIKASTNMHFMKSDMGGAAAVLGTMEVVAKLQLDIHLVCAVPVAENLLGSQAYLPSDVLTSYSGKTIEVIDTDAEGRLIMADALTYLNRNYQPEILIDIATLTGSSVRTLGYMAGALLTNNEELAENLYKAGLKTGEKLWRLPLWDDYEDDISSDIADVRNYSGKDMAGCISAGKFLEVFTEKHQAYAHLDIPGTAFKLTEFASSHIGTAFGVRLFLDFLSRI
ncbi:MAG: leucyl aminopeptidase family protein [Bacteroidetes bacterium]|nr:MAG: leucyl aminopeptidase family protein [Bacteroidota bacterium]TAG91226.1 MAG: leucyl aminopeptidase family protein [Bacteroidota bacterium]